MEKLRSHFPSRLPSKEGQFVEGFQKVWKELFSSPIHLDSILSKQPKKIKAALAQIIPSILLRPASQAEALGVGVSPGEPWTLSTSELKRWRSADLMAERMYQSLVGRMTDAKATESDFPPAMLEEWKAAWGDEIAQYLVETLGSEPPLSLRASKKLGARSLLKSLTSGLDLPVRAQVSDFSPFGVRLSGYAQVLHTSLFERGDFEIQDEGSQVMALFALWPEKFALFLTPTPHAVFSVLGKRLMDLSALGSPPAWTVVDACAGAGGKSLAIADALEGRGRIFSYDIAGKKLQALKRRAKRAGLRNIQTCELKEGSENEVIKKFRKRAQIVLVDAPCSGWGVLRRNPDIKWRQSQEALLRMPAVQERLLGTYSDLVAPGGRLVYGVCTFRLSETRSVVEAFLKNHPDFEAQEGGYLGPGTCDGFFMQSLVRRISR